MHGILTVFDDFAQASGLKISLEKSTLCMAGITPANRNAILARFPFDSGQFPVRYLGLPLLTKQMTKNDYKLLIEKLRTGIGTWTSRYLSYARHLQLIDSVIMSTSNIWMSAFRLPGA